MLGNVCQRALLIYTPFVSTQFMAINKKYCENVTESHRKCLSMVSSSCTCIILTPALFRVSKIGPFIYIDFLLIQISPSLPVNPDYLEYGTVFAPIVVEFVAF